MRSSERTDFRYVRAVLGFGIVAGLIGVVYLMYLSTVVGLDFRTHYFAAISSLSGEPFIGQSPIPDVSTIYVYPPVSIFYFYPLVLFRDWVTAYIAHTVITLILSGLFAILVINITEENQSLHLIDKVLISGFIMFSVPAVTSLSMGHLNVHILFGLTAAYHAAQQQNWRVGGLAFGIATVLKGWPALLGVYFLRRQAFRLIIMAVTTFGALTGISIAVLGLNTFLSYIRLVMNFRSEQFVGGLSGTFPYVTLRRPIASLFPQLSSTFITLIAVAALIPVLLYIYTNVDSENDQLVAYLGTVVTVLLIIPSTFYYVLFVYFPLLPLLYRLDQGWHRHLLITGTVLIQFLFTSTMIMRLLQLTPLSTNLQRVIVTITSTVFSIATIPLIGLLALLGGCVVYTRLSDSNPQSTHTHGQPVNTDQDAVGPRTE